MYEGCVFCVFLLGRHLSSKKQLHPVIFVQHTALITWKWNVTGRNSLSSPFSILSLHSRFSLYSMTLRRQCTLLLLLMPPTLHGMLRLWQDSITLQVFNTLRESPSLFFFFFFTQARCSSSPWPRKTITHPHLIPLQPTEISPGFHTTTNLASWIFSRFGEEGKL